VRFSLDPGGDVEVPDGITLGRCRVGLAALAAGWPADTPLSVDGRLLADDQVAGAEPWVAGTLLGPGPGLRDPVARAAAAPWHLAVVGGPDAGAVGVPDQRGVLQVGRRTAPGGGQVTTEEDRPDRTPGLLLLGDPAVSRGHLVLRERRGAGPPRWRVQDDGSVNGTLLLKASVRGRPSRAIGRRSRAVHPADRLVVGATTLELRRHAAAGDPEGGPPRRTAVGPSTGRPRGADPDHPSGGAPPQDGAGEARRPADRPAGMLGWAVPLAGAVALVAITRSPVGLVLALGAVGPAVTWLWGRRRPRGGRARPWVLAPDPAATAISLADPARPPGAAASPAAPWLDLAAAGLAVVGPRRAVMATAHGLLGAALAADDDLALAVLQPAEQDAQWAWCRWLEDSPRPGWPRVARDATTAAAVLGATHETPGGEHDPGAPTHLVVSDGSDPWRTSLHRWWSTGRGHRDGLLLLEESGDAVPAWCRWVLRVGGGQPMLDGPGGRRVVEVPTAPAGWIEAQARQFVARGRRSAGGPGRLPARVGLAMLGLPGDAAAVRRAWQATEATTSTGLVARIGVAAPAGPVAPVDLDLLADGPHALIAGTTGSGKSELLQALVLSLALRYPPSRLALVLVDFKGGAGLGRCGELPHVVGKVTDLDPVEAGRALDGLRAELRRREQLLAAHGVGDLEDLRALTTAPPRLVVVVDELKALVEDLPDFVPRLVRVAAQGRSLGIHLVLATQRPSGVVDAQLRANVAVRICLRVADTADSTDVVDRPDAAAIPVDLPGRAVLRCGPGPVRLVQTAWPALAPADGPGDRGLASVDGPGDRGLASVDDGRAGPSQAPAGREPVVRRALPWGAWPHDPPVRTDHAEHLVCAIRDAARGRPSPDRLWLPPLPATLDLAALGPVAPGVLPFGLVDRPADQGQHPLGWDPRTGPLLVAGGPASGRTTALTTLAVAALDRGWHVHAVLGRAGQQLWPALDPDPTTHPGLGTVVTVEDPRRLARLLTVLANAGPATVPRLLVVDDVDAVRAALARLPRGAPPDLLDLAVRAGTRPGLAVALSGAPSDLVRLLTLAGTRVVLAVPDPHDDALLGVPRTMAGGRGAPGRGIVVGADPARCQVAVAGLPAWARAGHATGHRPVRLAELPLVAALAPRLPGAPPDAPSAAGQHPAVATPQGPTATVEEVVLGPGGDDGAPVVVGLGAGLLVVGPAGSGRSTALAAVAARLPVDRTVTVPPDVDPARLVDLLAPGRHGRVLVLDDLDLLLRARPGLEDILTGPAGAPLDPGVPRLVAAARTDRAAAAYRGPLADLRSSAPVLVLSPLAPGSVDVAGCELWPVVDPAWPDHPGRGALVDRGRAVPVQVAPAANPPGSGAAAP